jgi:hypothetical protein
VGPMRGGKGHACVKKSLRSDCRVVFLVFVMDDDGYGADRVSVVEHG